MTQPTQPDLTQALAAYQAAVAHSYSSSDKALAAVLAALAGEITRLRRDLMVATSFQQGGAPPELLAELRSLRAQVEALQQQAAAPAAGSPAPARRSKPAPVSAPAVARPMEYWVENAPDFGGDTSVAERAAYLAQPRVRPQDIQLTAEDLARQQRVKGAKIYLQGFEPGRSAPSPTSNLARLAILVLLVTLLVLACSFLNNGRIEVNYEFAPLCLPAVARAAAAWRRALAPGAAV